MPDPPYVAANLDESYVANAWPNWIPGAGQSTCYVTSGSTNACAWPFWVGTPISSQPTITTATSAQPWPTSWVQQPTSVTAINPPAWYTWTATGITPIVGVRLDQGVNFDVEPLEQPTLEQQQAARRSDLVFRNRSRAHALRRKFAERRAEQLLLECLDDTQRSEWTQHRYFHVETAAGRRRYRIARGTAGNIQLVVCDDASVLSKHGFPLRVGARFCCHVYHPDGSIPPEDNVLAQKLLIETNEQHFLELANVS